MERDLIIKNVSKSFGKDTILKDVSLTIKKGEFFSILGPSGCGKTTLLRMIAGFIYPDSGEILVGDDRIDKLPPEKRNVNTVFQNYALFPTMNVFDNVAFPLKLKGIAKEEIEKEVNKYLELVGLLEHKSKMPENLSGGQKQRVSIARALIGKPDVLLLDEPLSALDAKLRQKLLIELDTIHDEVGITFVFVTHDQEEALSVSDRIAVMNKGDILQIGTPNEIYEKPHDDFVADFIGESNIIGGTMVQDKLVDIFGAKFACVDVGFGTNKPVDVVIRPEDIDLVEPEKGTLVGRVTHLIFKGVHYEMEVTTPNGYEWLVHSTDMFPVGKEVGISVDPFDIQIMNKPESEDEEAVGVNE